MRRQNKQRPFNENGSALPLVVSSIVTLSALGVGMLAVASGVRHRATAIKNETAAMFAADAGYEKAIFWMSKQQDMLNTLKNGVPSVGGSIRFPGSTCNYRIEFFSFVGSHPVYRVVSNGRSGVFKRKVDVLVVQATSGWDMGMCRIASGQNDTTQVFFADGEVIDMPIQINNLKDTPDERDIYIQGNPDFLQLLTMGESKYTKSDFDKYEDVMSLFNGGIYFDQPDTKITDEATIQTKVDSFKDETIAKFRYTPTANAPVKNPQPAVYLEFFAKDDIGYVRITNNCTVRGFQQEYDDNTWDFRIIPGSDGKKFERYDIYAYHLRSEEADSTGERFIVPLTDTYVSQSFGEYESELGGRIFVDGNVIIGSGDSLLPGLQDVIKGKITIVAKGNIWIADSIFVEGEHDLDGLPSLGNPNSLGLIAQGVIKVVDPGMSDYSYVDGSPVEPADFKYVPIGRPDNPQTKEGDSDYYLRYLPGPTVVEAAITVGGGGWGAENVRRGSYGGRKEASGRQDYLIVRGTITESFRGVVGRVGSDGYLKRHYLDERLLQGILPGDIWLRGKFIPAPAGWHDYRPDT